MSIEKTTKNKIKELETKLNNPNITETELDELLNELDALTEHLEVDTDKKLKHFLNSIK